jgi:hypothetical protein
MNITRVTARMATRGWLFITSMTTTMAEHYENDYEDNNTRMTRMSVEDDYPEDGSMRMTRMSVEDD